MHSFNISELLQQAAATNIPQVYNEGARHHSLGIVNSEGNGKRITLSKKLIARLELEENFQLLPIPSEGVALIAQKLPSNQASTARLSSKGRGVCYSAGLVQLLTQLFKLDFSEHVSRTFTDITFDEIDGMPVAIVRFTKVEDNA